MTEIMKVADKNIKIAIINILYMIMKVQETWT